MTSAEDLSQEVFLRAYERLSQLRDGERFVAWLCQLARRVGRDWQKRSQRNGQVSHVASNVMEFAQQPPQEGSQVAELRDAIRQLPDDERMALHLFYLDEQPAVVARQVLGLSQSGFYKLLERAREHVGSIMRRNQEAIR
jgi:RNA polymerase sigma-70 factor (ECF subfamily)